MTATDELTALLDKAMAGKPNRLLARPIRVDDDIAYVTLTKGCEAVIDAADVPIVSAWSWQAKTDGHTVYGVRTDRSGEKPRAVSLHRQIMKEPEGLEVDHIDGNGLNNRRANLRVASKTQNVRNQRVRQDNTSGFKGVSWGKKRQKWLARIMVNGKGRHLGEFETPEAAHAAYCAASAKLHGQFGRTA